MTLKQCVERVRRQNKKLPKRQRISDPVAYCKKKRKKKVKSDFLTFDYTVAPDIEMKDGFEFEKELE